MITKLEINLQLLNVQNLMVLTTWKNQKSVMTLQKLVVGALAL